MCHLRTNICILILTLIFIVAIINLRGGMMYADVIIEYGNKAVDREFTYIVPEKLKRLIKIGHRVSVPFNNKNIEGFVMNLRDKYVGEYEVKEIISLCDDEPILNKEMLYLGNVIQKEILCSKISIYQAMLPKALKAKKGINIGIKQDRYIVLNEDKKFVLKYISECRYPSQVEIFKQII